MMKNLTFKTTLVFFLSFFLFGFSTITSNIDKEKLCKTWYIASGVLTEDGETEEVPEEMINSRFVFKKDNTFLMYELDVFEKGTWKEVDGKLQINIDEEAITFTVETLTDTQLVITMNEDDRKASMTFSTKKN